jgi:hypothetical protein
MYIIMYLYCDSDEIYEDLISDLKRLEEKRIIHLDDQRLDKYLVNERIDDMIDKRFISFRRHISTYYRENNMNNYSLRSSKK